MPANNQSEFTYFAFISYKREDEKWAKWLQNKLESYGFPVALRKDNPSLPSKIRPIFRDQSELSGGNLKDEIEKGLHGSKYLIVICSPQAAQSPWVSKEVQYYIDNGREDYIIPFIIGGSPNAKNPEEECFPEGLRQLSGEKEILGININEMGRDAAAIKVIARMFNLRFDTLWQRHERAKRRKRTGIIVGILAFAIVGFMLAGIMTSLRNEADLQRQKAEEQTVKAKLESQRANEERDNALKANKALELANDSIIKQTKIIYTINQNLYDSNNQLILERNRANLERNHVLRANDSIKKQIHELIEANRHLGLMYKQTGNFDDAFDYYNKASGYRLDLYGESSPEVASSYDNIGSVYSSQGNYAGALENYEKALKIRLEFFGENHPAVATSYNEIGLIYSNQGDYSAALAYFKKTLKIRSEIFDENHPNVATCYSNIGFVYDSLGDYSGALENYEKALEIRVKIFGENHPDVKSVKDNIANVKIKLDEQKH